VIRASSAGVIPGRVPSCSSASAWLSRRRFDAVSSGSPGRYTARCQQSGGASWLNVTDATGPGDHRPLITEEDGPLYGYHVDDLPLAQADLVADATAAVRTWTASRSG
jgi:hypothetical protein